MPGQFESILDKLQAKLGKQTIRKASTINRPRPKREVQQIQIFNEFNRRNPRADGGSVNGSEQAAFRKKVEELMDDGYDFGEAVREAMRQGYQDGGKTKKFTWSRDKKRPVKYSQALQKLIDKFKKTLLGSGVKLEVMRLNDPQGKTPLIRVRHSIIKDGVSTIKGTKNFDLTPNGFKDAKKYAEGMKADPKTYPPATPEKGMASVKAAENEYSKLKNQWTQEAIDFIEEATSSGKYKTVEEVNKALMEKFSDPKYTYEGLPRAVRKKVAFVRPDKYPGQLMFDYDYVFPKDSGLDGIQMKDRPYKGKTAQRDLILKGFLNNSTNKINPKFKNLSNSLFTFFTDPPKGESKPLLSVKNEEELKRFSKKYNLQGAKAGTKSGGSLLENYLYNRGLDFEKYKLSNEQAFGRATIIELRRELNRPDITSARKTQLENTIEALRKFDRGLRRRLYNKYPSLFKASRGGQSIVFEHLVARSIPEATGELFQSFERLPYDYRMRGRFVPAYFNKEKLKIFDKPLIDLIDQYESAPDESTRKSVEKDIKKLKKEFNDATKIKGKGYADNLEISFKKNRVILEDKTPVFKTGVSEVDLSQDILKNIEHSNKLFSNLGKQQYVYKGTNFDNFKKDIFKVKQAANSRGVTFNSFAGFMDFAQAGIELPPAVKQAAARVARVGGQILKGTGVGAAVLDPIFAAVDFSEAIDRGVGGKEAAKYTGKRFVEGVLNLPDLVASGAKFAKDKAQGKDTEFKTGTLYEPFTFAQESLDRAEAATPKATRLRNIAQRDFDTQVRPGMTMVDDMEIPASREQIKAAEQDFIKNQMGPYYKYGLENLVEEEEEKPLQDEGILDILTNPIYKGGVIKT
jgi:hypothetical protein